jgi:hypothetical protein
VAHVSYRPVLLFVTIGLLCAIESAYAGEADESEPIANMGFVRVAASKRYEAARIHRFTLGGGYRDLWEAEIELPVLDLATTGAGLVPTGRFGGLQTAVLGFKGGDGRLYSFRGTDKDPSKVLPAILQDTVIETLVQDQMAAQHPAGPLAAGVISEAAGVLTIPKTMVVLPDDPALGEFREEFAGMVGIFYEYPTAESQANPGFHGATELIEHKELAKRLERSQADQVAADEFLRARLLDILIGDFDRHRKQWRWAKLPGDPRWQPIPEDRDMAFVRYDGVGPRIASVYVPILQNYGPKYPWSMKGLTFHGWEQDRWLLPKLSWPEWEAIARDMQARITDEKIEEAVQALPHEYVELDGDRLRRDLTGRRDRLIEGARSYYEHLAGEVDVQETDDSEQVTVVRNSDGTMLVEVRKLDEHHPESTPVFSRSFDPGDTKDVRVYLRAGNDRVKVIGKSGDIRLRVIAGEEGHKQLDDSEGGNTTLYDQAGNVEVKPGPGTFVDRRHYVVPAGDPGFVEVKSMPPRDWGSDIIPIPQFGYEKDVGAFLGAGVIYTRYGFRKHPWSSKHRLTAGGATEAGQPRVTYGGQYQMENSNLVGQLDLHISGIEILNFYGFGNNTSDDGSDSFFRVRSRQYRAAPGVRYGFMDDRIRVSGGPVVQFTKTKSGNRKIDEVDPYGADKFGMVAATLNLQFDTRRTTVDPDMNLALPLHKNPNAGYPTSGFLVDFTAEVSPPVWDVTRTWGAIEGSLSGFLSMGENDRVTLAARVGGRDTYGRTPYFASAFIGGGEFFSGGSTVRGFRAERFVGESSAYGSFEVRGVLGRVKLIVPGDFGLIAFSDVGRIFEDGDSSDQWHLGYGGGIWFAPLARANAIRFTVAHSDEDTLFYMGLGFGF